MTFTLLHINGHDYLCQEERSATDIFERLHKQSPHDATFQIRVPGNGDTQTLRVRPGAVVISYAVELDEAAADAFMGVVTPARKPGVFGSY